MLPPNVILGLNSLLKLSPALPEDVIPLPALPLLIRLPPPMSENMVDARSEKPMLLVLFAPPIMVIWSLFTKRFTMAFPSYLSLFPYPA
ncbi:hypothetical protein EVA_08810 [gut metagenome]|uniref:Uncharacterized protein n=1 Tax=gut metagenome TaxID=749906 RepID=J9G780_9ZZZZ